MNSIVMELRIYDILLGIHFSRQRGYSLSRINKNRDIIKFLSPRDNKTLIDVAEIWYNEDGFYLEEIEGIFQFHIPNMKLIFEELDSFWSNLKSFHTHQAPKFVYRKNNTHSLSEKNANKLKRIKERLQY